MRGIRRARAGPRATGHGRRGDSACRPVPPHGSSTRSVTSASETASVFRLYLDTSAVLRAVLETGTTPVIEERIGAARVLVSSRLSLVESCRAFVRLRAAGGIAEARLVDAERDVAAIWSRCELWEMTRGVCETACAC